MNTEDIKNDDLEFQPENVDYTPEEEEILDALNNQIDEPFDEEMPFELDDEQLTDEVELPEEVKDSQDDSLISDSFEEEDFEEPEFEKPELEVEEPELGAEESETEIEDFQNQTDNTVEQPPVEDEQIMYKDPNEPEKTDEYFNKERDRYLRLFAEFENYRRRTIKEREELKITAGQDILSAMLPIVDDFDRALVELAKTADENTLKGVELIYNKLVNTLKSKGLQRIEVAPNDVFDSEIHDAITLIPAPSPEYKGRIVDVVQAGYKLGDKIIRFPKVVVAQ